MIDFIVKLLKSEDISTDVKYNNILIITNKLTKYAHFILCIKKLKLKQIVWIILNRIIKQYGILMSIILDRDKIFTSKFWQTLIIKV